MLVFGRQIWWSRWPVARQVIREFCLCPCHHDYTRIFHLSSVYAGKNVALKCSRKLEIVAMWCAMIGRRAIQEGVGGERIIVVHNDEVNSKDSEAFFWETGIWVELHRVPGGLKRVPERLLRAPLKTLGIPIIVNDLVLRSGIDHVAAFLARL